MSLRMCAVLSIVLLALPAAGGSVQVRDVADTSGSGATPADAAVVRYDRSDVHVATVPGSAHTDSDSTGPAAKADSDRAVVVAVAYATAQRGLPYVWGGNGPDRGDAGFDCSGLTHAAYAAAGISIPRTAQTQFDAGPRLGPGELPVVGDLVFYGSPGRVHHVGLYVEGGRMINAPTFGEPVRLAAYRWPGDDYVGASRPAGGAGSLRSFPVGPSAPRSGAASRGGVPAVPAPARSRPVPAVPIPVPVPTVTPTVPPSPTALPTPSRTPAATTRPSAPATTSPPAPPPVDTGAIAPAVPRRTVTVLVAPVAPLLTLVHPHPQRERSNP